MSKFVKSIESIYFNLMNVDWDLIKIILLLVVISVIAVTIMLVKLPEERTNKIIDKTMSLSNIVLIGGVFINGTGSPFSETTRNIVLLLFFGLVLLTIILNIRALGLLAIPFGLLSPFFVFGAFAIFGGGIIAKNAPEVLKAIDEAGRVDTGSSNSGGGGGGGSSVRGWEVNQPQNNTNNEESQRADAWAHHDGYNNAQDAQDEGM